MIGFTWQLTEQSDVTVLERRKYLQEFVPGPSVMV